MHSTGDELVDSTAVATAAHPSQGALHARYYVAAAVTLVQYARVFRATFFVFCWRVKGGLRDAGATHLSLSCALGKRSSSGPEHFEGPQGNVMKDGWSLPTGQNG